jgi:hypothetical protein
MKTYHPYGGTQVFFTKEEMKEIKDFGPPGSLFHSFSSVQPLFHPLFSVEKYRSDFARLQAPEHSQNLSQFQTRLFHLP